MKSIFLALVFVLLLQGCALFRHKRKPADPASPPPRLAGSVSFVNEERGFVLVDVGSSFCPAAGQALKTFRNGHETAVLTVTAERRRPFVSADIARGEPRQGDEVWQ